MTTFVFPNLRSWIGLVAYFLGTFMFMQSAQAQGCSQPSNLESVVSASNVTLSWSAISGARDYTVQYRVGESGRWTTAPRTTATSLILTGLLPNTVYSWRVKASCSTYSSIAKFNTGGGTGGNVSCSQPSNLTANTVTTTSVKLGWSAIEGALNYTVQYRPGTSGTWLNGGTTTATSLTLSGLQSNTKYTWRVKASCSDYSSVAEFTTGTTTGGGGGGGSTSCSAPSNTNTDAVFTNRANVSWEPVAEASNYTVQYRLESARTYTTVGTTTNANITINGLQPGRKYVWRVKASCSPYGSDVQFETPLSSTNTVGTTTVTAGSTTLAPNPVNGDLALLNLETVGAQIVVMDYLGKVIINEINTDTQHQLNVGNLPNGIYAIHVRYNENRVVNVALVIAK